MVRVSFAYVDCCCISLDSDRFVDLLSNNVVLRHQRTKNLLFLPKEWMQFFPSLKKYIFENTSEIALKSFTLEETQDGVSLKLIVEENKNNFDKDCKVLV